MKNNELTKEGQETGTEPPTLQMNIPIPKSDQNTTQSTTLPEDDSENTSGVQSVSNYSAEDGFTDLILNAEQMEVEIERLKVVEKIEGKENLRKLRKRVKRKMKRHQKRWDKMSEKEKTAFEQAKQAHLRSHKSSINSFFEGGQKEGEGEEEEGKAKGKLMELSDPDKEEDTRFNADACDLSTGLKKGFKMKIADLGNGCWTHYHFQPEIQTRQYRGPEVILGINYNETADLWSFACMIFEMLTGDFLFDPKKTNEFKKNDDHLAQMIELLNEFPKDWATIGTHSKRYFDKDGKLKKIKTLRFWGLKDILIQRYKMAEEEAIAFEDFLLPMLEVLPQNRATARQMINHRWLDMRSTDFRSSELILNHQNDEQRFQKVINETDLYADIDLDEFQDDSEDESDFIIEGGRQY